ECGAVNRARAAHCWLCRREMTAKDTPPRGAGAAQSTSPYGERVAVDRPPQFGLSSLFLIITLVAVCLGLVVAAPGLIVLLIVVVTPALIRTFGASALLTRRGVQLTTIDKIAALVTSVGVMIAIWMAAGVAFLAACGVVCATGESL